MHCCRIVNGIKNKNIKNSLDDNMEYWQKVHQIPNGISSHLFRDNMYIIS